MYTIAISVAIGVACGTAACFLPYVGWFAVPIGMVFAVLAMILITRRVAKRLEERFLTAQKQVQAKQFKLAAATLEALLPMSRWQILLAGQIHAQLGVIHFAERDEDKALKNLAKASPRVPEAMLIRAVLHHRKKEPEKVRETMELAVRLSKKQVILWNAWAFMLEQSGAREEAIAVLQRGLKKNPGHEATTQNLLQLQNGKKLNMKPFGMNWYSLQLEKPPMSMMQEQFTGRPGFRQPPRRSR